MSVSFEATRTAKMVADLSPPEKNCLQLIAEGHSLREIGLRLTLPTQDVEGLVMAAEVKLGASNRLHAISLAMLQGHIEF